MILNRILLASLLVWNAFAFRAFIPHFGHTINQHLCKPAKLQFDRDKMHFLRAVGPGKQNIHQKIGDRNYPDGGLMLNIADFDQILHSIEIYKTLHGSLDIPLRFVIPTSKVWPPELHGFQLGRRLEQLQTSKNFYHEHSDKVEALAKLGWDMRRSKLVDEWIIVKRGLTTYKEIYGDTRVPVKFVVPDESPWDPVCRNDLLGVRVSTMRSTGRYVKENPARKAELDAMGFEWAVKGLGSNERAKVDEERFDKVLQTLRLFQEKHGHDAILPSTFVVPSEPSWPESLHGFSAGYFVAQIEKTHTMLIERPDRIQALKDLGINIEMEQTTSQVADAQFADIYSALIVYKQIFGDLLVPHKFRVPAEAPWPEDTWSMHLGVRVTLIRTQGKYVKSDPTKRRALDDLGFTWELRPERRLKKRLATQEERELRHQQYRDEQERRIEAVTQGKSLAVYEEERQQREALAEADAQAQDMSLSKPPRTRRKLSALDKVDLLDPELENLFGDNDPTKGPIAGASSKMDPFAPTIRSLDDLPIEESEEQIQAEIDEIFSIFHPDERVLLDNETPEEEADNQSFYDPSLPIDYSVENGAKIMEFLHAQENSDDPKIRARAAFYHSDIATVGQLLQHEASPEGVAFMKDVGYRILEFGKHNFERFIEALRIFKDFYGHVDVPIDYVIDRTLVPEMSRAAIAQRQKEKQQREADAYAGYDKHLDQKTLDLLNSALEDPVKIRSTSSNVAVKQVDFPLNHPVYPVHLFGLQLGEGVWSVRHGDYDGFEDPVRRKILDELGFDWGNIGVHQRFRFVPMLWGLKLLKKQEEMCMPDTDFIVPDDDPIWPRWMVGMPLGQWAATLRVQQQMMKEYYPQRVAVLNALEFLWFIPPGPTFPEKFYEPLVQPPDPVKQYLR